MRIPSRREHSQGGSRIIFPAGIRRHIFPAGFPGTATATNAAAIVTGGAAPSRRPLRGHRWPRIRSLVCLCALSFECALCFWCLELSTYLSVKLLLRARTSALVPLVPRSRYSDTSPTYPRGSNLGPSVNFAKFICEISPSPSKKNFLRNFT